MVPPIHKLEFSLPDRQEVGHQGLTERDWVCSRDGEITQELGRLDLNDLDTGLEWEESLQDHQVEGREEPGLVSAGGYLYRLAAGDTEVHRFSVMIGVWGQADPIQSVF